MASIKLGELLVKAQVLQEGQLKSALAEQKKLGGKLGEVLVRMSLVTEDLLTRALSRQLNVPVVQLDGMPPPPQKVRDLISHRLAKDLCAVPLSIQDDGKALIVAMAEPTSSVQLELLRGEAKLRIVPQLSSPTAINRTITRFYQALGEMTEVESSFRLMDSQGRPLSQKGESQKVSATAPAAALKTSPGARSAGSADVELAQLEQLQRQEVTMLKAMVELLIQKGVFTREEYMAKLKR